MSLSPLPTTGFVQHSERLFVHDLYTDLRDGLALLSALEVLSGAKLPREKARNMQRVHHLTNVRTALRFLEERKIKLVNINATDVVDGKPAIVLGLVWTLVLYWQIESEEQLLLSTLQSSGAVKPEQIDKFKGNPRKALLGWVGDAITKCAHAPATPLCQARPRPSLPAFLSCGSSALLCCPVYTIIYTSRMHYSNASFRFIESTFHCWPYVRLPQ